MKLLILVVISIWLVGCKELKYANNIDRATDLCKEHGGVKTYVQSFNVSFSCTDGVSYSWVSY